MHLAGAGTGTAAWRASGQQAAPQGVCSLPWQAPPHREKPSLHSKGRCPAQHNSTTGLMKTRKAHASGPADKAGPCPPDHTARGRKTRSPYWAQPLPSASGEPSSSTELLLLKKGGIYANGKAAYATKTNVYVYMCEGQVRLNHMRLPFLWQHKLYTAFCKWS